jgi:hypothetical protein
MICSWSLWSSFGWISIGIKRIVLFGGGVYTGEALYLGIGFLLESGILCIGTYIFREKGTLSPMSKSLLTPNLKFVLMLRANLYF